MVKSIRHASKAGIIKNNPEKLPISAYRTSCRAERCLVDILVVILIVMGTHAK
jgi:hypothetical protein